MGTAAAGAVGVLVGLSLVLIDRFLGSLALVTLTCIGAIYAIQWVCYGGTNEFEDEEWPTDERGGWS